MQLISLPVSPFAARVRIAIYAKNLNVTLAPPPSGWPRVWDRTLGPIGRVPVLICDDGIIPESQVILEYLEEQFRDRWPLLPERANDRARVRLLSRVVDLYLMPPIVSLADTRGRPSAAEAVLDALRILDDMVGANRYANGEALSLGDCALVPALFAARVTGKRHGFDMFADHENLRRYFATVEQHDAAGRVLREMQQGLQQIEGASSN